VRLGWVGADAGYGTGPDFLFALEDMGETLLIDVHKTFAVYERDPEPKARRSSGKGRIAMRLSTEERSRSVEQIVESSAAGDWRVLSVREATRGLLKLRALVPRLRYTLYC
jgi:SRSO17 transposase